MKWQKEKLKMLVKERGLTHDQLAVEIGVSRQTVASWFAGQVPKGLHLMKLWSLLQLAPGALFQEDSPHYITRAMYHTIGNGPSLEKVKNETEALVARYAGFFTKKGSTANRRKSLCAAATRPNTAGRLGAPRCRAGTPPLPSRMRQGALQVISL